MNSSVSTQIKPLFGSRLSATTPVSLLKPNITPVISNNSSAITGIAPKVSSLLHQTVHRALPAVSGLSRSGFVASLPSVSKSTVPVEASAVHELVAKQSAAAPVAQAAPRGVFQSMKKALANFGKVVAAMFEGMGTNFGIAWGDVSRGAGNVGESVSKRFHDGAVVAQGIPAKVLARVDKRVEKITGGVVTKTFRQLPGT